HSSPEQDELIDKWADVAADPHAVDADDADDDADEDNDEDGDADEDGDNRAEESPEAQSA
ncbi:MAG: hypothetical protein LH605_00680, partial [Microbacteriaceae bacterium]|nr:hypothetical protein [Microbacteriaceae bacterium]